MKEITAYKCKVCGTTHDDESDAYKCEFKHAQTALANSLFRKGYPLSVINYYCGYGWNLSKEREEITQDSCFVISHWQCCDKPAYKITRIEDNGWVMVMGCGSWSGYYGHEVRVDELPKPHPKEELFIDKRYGQ